jgi:glutaredoxin
MSNPQDQSPMLEGDIMSSASVKRCPRASLECLRAPQVSDLRRLMKYLFLLLLFAFAGGSATAQTTTTLYKSVGPDGKTIYSDRPAPDAREAKTLTFRNAPASPLSAETLLYIDELKKSADASIKNAGASETVLFSAVWCGYCKLAKTYLATKKVSYREVDIDTRDGLLAFARAGGKRGVPFLLANGQTLSGFSSASYDAILEPRK